MPWRKIPSDLWLHEWRKPGREWVGNFLIAVSLDEFQHGKPKPSRYYAAQFGAPRSVVRRLLREREIELSEQPRDNPETTQKQPKPISVNGHLEQAVTQDQPKTDPRTTQLLETETETETQDPPTPRKRGARVDLAGEWHTIGQVFELAGKRAPRRTAARDKLISQRVKEHGEGVGARLARGYWAFHARPGPEFDPDKFFTVDTILRASHSGKYLDALAEVGFGKTVAIGGRKNGRARGHSRRDRAASEARAELERDHAVAHPEPVAGCTWCSG